MTLLPLALVLLTAPLAAPLAAPEESAQSVALELGREHCRLFFDKELETLWERFSADMKRAVGGSLAGLGATHEALVAQVGEELEILDEVGHDLPTGYAYVRTARFSGTAQELDFTWQFDREKIVLGFTLRPTQKEAESRFLDYQTKTPLRLPFEDAWDVFWGGRSLAQNYHTAYPDQRFAYDLLIFQDGKTHSGTGERNEDYFCFGKRLVCPGDGTVVTSANDVEDNVPGEMNPARALGNHVVIDHGNGEFSFLAHFKKGSLAVKAGDAVKSGDFLGLAGNSGNTSEPHLHYHLQTTAVFNRGEGLPPQFLNYVANGEHVERGEPVKGDTLQPAKAE